MDKMIEIGRRPAINTIARTLGQDTIGAEVGVNKGFNASYICSIIKPKILYLIDPWSNFFDPDSGEIIGEAQYIMTHNLLKPFPCCQFIRDTSYNVVKNFQDGSLDFVYIDSDHSYQAVLKEVRQWYPKVRKGGILSGHDCSNASPQVVKALVDFCYEIKLKEFCNQEQDWWIFR